MYRFLSILVLLLGLTVGCEDDHSGECQAFVDLYCSRIVECSSWEYEECRTNMTNGWCRDLDNDNWNATAYSVCMDLLDWPYPCYAIWDALPSACTEFSRGYGW